MKKSVLIQLLTTAVVSIYSLISCNNKSGEAQIYIVDSIKLGNSMKDFSKQVVKNKDFFFKKARKKFW